MTVTRISADHKDPAFHPHYQRVRVLLDGVEQKLCILADSAEGWIKRAVTNEDGDIVSGGGEVEFEIVHGRVELVWPPGVDQ